MRVSVCIATYDKPAVLGRVLESIVWQEPPWDWEVIVVDDGSPNGDTEMVCSRYARVRYRRIIRRAEYRNPAIARNTAYRMARGEVVITQSDDVVHGGEDTIRHLTEELRPGRFVVAHVVNTDAQLQPTPCLHPNNPRLVELSGPKGRRPLLFLGALYRRDIYAIGGNDERFTAPGYEDQYFAECLTNGLGRIAYFSTVQGYHLHHDRPPIEVVESSRQLHRQLKAKGRWQSSGGPWPYLENGSPT